MVVSTSSTQSQVAVLTYLVFNGRCEEALEFYRTAIGAELEGLRRFEDSPEPHPPGMVKPGFEKKVMHAEFRIGDSRFMASDHGGPDMAHSGFSLALIVSTAADADRCFDALAKGGQVRMPLGRTFWSPRFGMLTDRFGIDWMINMQGGKAG
jgi:PhnB protein